MSTDNSKNPNQMRPVSLERHYSPQAEGSVLVTFGRTQVLCTATVEDSQPRWLKGTSKGWVTAEYAMLPRATASRTQRERRGATGRSQEIQRLIGRSLRQSVSLEGLRGYSLIIDCDVLRADGGTRTASITGACVALADAARGIVDLKQDPFKRLVAAISVGMVKGVPVLDMDYHQDSNADVDLNLVAAEDGEIIEVQGTGEARGFSRQQLDDMLDLGLAGCQELFELQRQALAETD